MNPETTGTPPTVGPPVVSPPTTGRPPVDPAAAAAAAAAVEAVMSVMTERSAPRRRRRRWFIGPILICLVGLGALLLYRPGQPPAPIIRMQPPASGDTTPEKPMTVYKWTDADGETHYSNIPPQRAGQTYETMEVEVRNPVPAGEEADTPPEAAGGAPTPASDGLNVVQRAVQSVGAAVAPVIEAYRQAPHAVEKTREAAQQMEQRQQSTQAALEQAHP